jgi:hypothetical protein
MYCLPDRWGIIWMWEDRVIMGPDPSDALSRCRLLHISAYPPMACGNPKSRIPTGSEDIYHVHQTAATGVVLSLGTV